MRLAHQQPRESIAFSRTTQRPDQFDHWLRPPKQGQTPLWPTSRDSSTGPGALAGRRTAQRCPAGTAHRAGGDPPVGRGRPQRSPAGTRHALKALRGLRRHHRAAIRRAAGPGGGRASQRRRRVGRDAPRPGTAMLGVQSRHLSPHTLFGRFGRHGQHHNPCNRPRSVAPEGASTPPRLRRHDGSRSCGSRGLIETSI